MAERQITRVDAPKVNVGWMMKFVPLAIVLAVLAALASGYAAYQASESRKQIGELQHGWIVLFDRIKKAEKAFATHQTNDVLKTAPGPSFAERWEKASAVDRLDALERQVRMLQVEATRPRTQN